MNEQEKARQVEIEGFTPEISASQSFYGKRVFCPHCNKNVSIISKIGMRNPDPEDCDNTEVFKTSCGHQAFGEVSYSYPEDGYEFWFE